MGRKMAGRPRFWRRVRPVVLALVAVCLLAAGCDPKTGILRTSEGPNVVLILTDDLDARLLREHPADYPNLQKLAAEGTTGRLRDQRGGLKKTPGCCNPIERSMGREDGGVTDGAMIGRRNFLRLVGGAGAAATVGLLAACSGGTSAKGTSGETPEGQRAVGGAADRGRLLSRAAPPPSRTGLIAGLRPLGLGSGRDGLLYVPPGYDGASKKAPLALMLHGAGGDARSGISHFLDLADEAGLVLLAPESRGRTWDVLVGVYGPDVAFIDRALGETFDRLAVDAEKVAAAGFSDGASYALSLGLTNGDLFTRVIAFSPGFASPAARRGKPPVFVSHGTRDGVLPIERCSRRIVPRLEREGYEVRYREFDGPHTVPRSIAREALAWFVVDHAAADADAPPETP